MLSPQYFALDRSETCKTSERRLMLSKDKICLMKLRCLSRDVAVFCFWWKDSWVKCNKQVHGRCVCCGNSNASDLWVRKRLALDKSERKHSWIMLAREILESFTHIGLTCQYPSGIVVLISWGCLNIRITKEEYHEIFDATGHSPAQGSPIRSYGSQQN